MPTLAILFIEVRNGSLRWLGAPLGGPKNSVQSMVAIHLGSRCCLVSSFMDYIGLFSVVGTNLENKSHKHHHSWSSRYTMCEQSDADEGLDSAVFDLHGVNASDSLIADVRRIESDGLRKIQLRFLSVLSLCSLFKLKLRCRLQNAGCDDCV